MAAALPLMAYIGVVVLHVKTGQVSILFTAVTALVAFAIWICATLALAFWVHFAVGGVE
jgi:hypothetical protein